MDAEMTKGSIFARSVKVFKSKVVVSEEHYLPVALDDLVGVLQGRLLKTGDQERSAMLKDFVRLVEGLYRFNFNRLQRVLLNDLRPFCAGAMKRKLLTTQAVADDIHHSLDDMELAFLEALVQLLQAAHFQLLTKEEYECALAEEFQMTLPMAVNLDSMDPSLLHKYWELHPDARAVCPTLADNCLVFHRGVKKVTFIHSDVNAKVQQIVKYLIIFPITQYVLALMTWLYSKTKMAWLKGGIDYITRSSLWKSMMHSFDAPENEAKVADREESVNQQLKDKMTMNYERVPFRRAYPTTMSLIKGILTKKELQEPAFRDVVVVYREKVHLEEEEKKDLSPLEQELRERNIVIKRFADVPMADIEIVFPDHKIFLQPVTRLQLFAQFIGLLVGTWAMFTKTEWGAEWVISLLVLVGGRIATAMGQAEAERSNLERQINKMVYDKTLAAQEAVLFLTLDEMLQQYTKSAVLLYFTLLANGRPMTTFEVETATLQLLYDSFGLVTALDVEHVVPQLVEDGIVTQKGDVLTCVPLEQAVTLLDEKWDELFDYAGADEDELQQGTQEAAAKLATEAGKGRGQSAFGLSGIVKDIKGKTQIKKTAQDSTQPGGSPGPSLKSIKQTVDSGVASGLDGITSGLDGIRKRIGGLSAKSANP